MTKKVANTTLTVFLLFVCQFIACRPSTDYQKELEGATLLFQEGKFQESLNALNDIIERYPSEIKGHRLRSKCYYELNDRIHFIEELKLLSTFEEVSCQEKLVYANDIANTYDYLLSTDSAIKYQWLVLELKKSCINDEISDYFVYEILATLYTRIGNFDKAFQMLDSSNSLGNDPYSIAAAHFRVFDKAGMADSALQSITKAILLQREYPGKITQPGFDFLSRANLYQKINNLPAACADWQKAFQLGTEEAKLKLDSFCTKTR